ncbi:hypothetical protein [Aquiflexum lacus]|nr:hypothetical protein [Aquiflexum lacus]
MFILWFSQVALTESAAAIISPVLNDPAKRNAFLQMVKKEYAAR